jgi:hypothetical protein
MPVRVTVETASKSEAELIAKQLPVTAQAQSWRGLGVIRLALKNRGDVHGVLEAVSHGFQEHRLHWARVRYGDEERVFRANGHRSG